MQVYFPDNESVLQSRMMVAWKRSRSAYNFRELPDAAVICVDYAVLKSIRSFRSKDIKGIKGRNFIHQGILFCSSFDNGGAGILNLLEELHALGVSRFVFLGLAGRLSDSAAEGGVYAVTKAISGSGATAYYFPEEEIRPFHATFLEKIGNAVSATGCICFSTDAPFRETRTLLEQCVSRGASLIEMECAAIYAFSRFYKTEAACLLTGADSLSGDWCAPSDFAALLAAQRALIPTLIKALS